MSECTIDVKVTVGDQQPNFPNSLFAFCTNENYAVAEDLWLALFKMY